MAGCRAVLALVVLLALAGCGSGDDEGAGLICPPLDDRAPLGRFDAKELVGETPATGRRIARAHGCSVRVGERNGEGLYFTSDLVPGRITVAVTDGRISDLLMLESANGARKL